MDVVCVLLYLTRRCFGASTEDVGINFEDKFKRFESALWRRDFGTRQCGVMGNCMFAKQENIRYESHHDAEKGSYEASEMIISMNGDCEDDFCCVDDFCTHYTSGMITSRQTYSYGSFQFWLKIESKTKNFELILTSFKSVRCISSPRADEFPAILAKVPTEGYCENSNADLEKYQSNRDLCSGRGKNICARYRWVIKTFSAITINWKVNGDNKIDYESSAIFVDGSIFSYGGRDTIQDFDVVLKQKTTYTVDVYGFESCCAGSSDEGYHGWQLTSLQTSGGDLNNRYGSDGVESSGSSQRLLPDSDPSSSSSRWRKKPPPRRFWRGRQSSGKQPQQPPTSSTSMTTHEPTRIRESAQTTSETLSTISIVDLPFLSTLVPPITFRSKNRILHPSTGCSDGECEDSLSESSSSSETDRDSSHYAEAVASSSSNGASQINPTNAAISTNPFEPEAPRQEVSNPFRLPDPFGEPPDSWESHHSTPSTTTSPSSAPNHQINPFHSPNPFHNSTNPFDSLFHIPIQFPDPGPSNITALIALHANHSWSLFQNAHPKSPLLPWSLFQFNPRKPTVPMLPFAPPTTNPFESDLSPQNNPFDSPTRPPRPSNPFDLPAITDPGSPDQPIQNPVPSQLPEPATWNPFDTTVKPEPKNPFESPTKPLRPSNPFNLPAITDPGSPDQPIQNPVPSQLPKPATWNPFETTVKPEPKNPFEPPTKPPRPSNPFHLPAITDPGSPDQPVQNPVPTKPTSWNPFETTRKSKSKNPFESPTKPPRASNPFDLPQIMSPGGTVLYPADTGQTDSSADKNPFEEEEIPTTFTNFTLEEGDSTSAGMDLPAASDDERREGPGLEAFDADESDNDCHSDCCSSDAIPYRECCSTVECFRPSPAPGDPGTSYMGQPSSPSNSHSPHSGPHSHSGSASSPRLPDIGTESIDEPQDSIGPWTDFEGDSSVPDSPWLGFQDDAAAVFSEFEEPIETSETQPTTDSPYTTTEAHGRTSSTETADKTSCLDSDIALICISLQRIIKAMGELGIARISICFQSCRSRQAVLIAIFGENIYRETVELPFDASTKARQYSIDWMPNKIVWKVGKKSIRSVGHNLAPIPDKAMHIKFFVAPKNPYAITNPNVEHKLHLFFAKYEKFCDPNEKTELFVLGRNVWNRTTFIASIAMMSVILLICVWPRKEKYTPEGYIMLQVRDLTVDI